MSRRRAALSATALAVGALLASGPAASAAHIEVADGTLVFTAEVGERNDVQAGARNLPTFTINDDGAPLTAGAGCVQVSPSSATCDEDPLNPLPLSIATRDGDDRVLVDDDFARVVTVEGGSGDDDLDVGSRIGAPDVLDGGSGDDRLTTRMNTNGPPILRGGSGDDVLTMLEVGGAQAYGGDGDDRIVYGATAFAFPVVLDGGDGNDRYTLTQKFLDGAIVPGRGFDALDQSTSRQSLDLELSTCAGCFEKVRGTQFGDRIVGDRRSQVILGGPGDDELDGGGGTDALAGQAGADTITSTDGSIDVVSCGADADTVQADRRDFVSRDCEARS